MWKKGELVWASLNYPDSWTPGRVQDPSESFGVLVSFFGLKEPRYFPAPFIRRFERDFRTLISGSLRLRRRIVNRALRAHFWSVSYGLWCPCQPPITSPYLDTENSVLWSSLSSDLALGFVRDIAISRSVPLEGLAEANRSTAQILSFRRYSVDFEQSRALYEEISVSGERMGHSEEPEPCPDPSNEGDCLAVDPVIPETAGSDMGNDKDSSVRDLGIPGCCPSPAEQLVEGDEVQICSWNPMKPLANSGDSVFLRACKTLAQLAKQEDDHPSKSAEHGHGVVAHAEQLPRLDAATTHGNQTRTRDTVKSIKMKREASLNITSAYSFKKQKIAAQQSESVGKPLNLCTLKATRIADPRCLRMKFLGNSNDLPSEASLVKRFSVFGKIDASKTYVDTCKRSAKVVFLRSIDAVMAYKYARREKILFGQSNVVYRFDLFERGTEGNKVDTAEEEPQELVPMLKPCLKKPGSTDEARRRKLKVKFQMEDNC